MTGLREVIIIGGGLAGLSAALYLGRSRRDTLLIHSGHDQLSVVSMTYSSDRRGNGSPRKDLMYGEEETRSTDCQKH
jgi:thioredoxin reductase